jgi:ubiquinone/menaquinone biosynthesis C-methylase UbiE
MLPPPSAGNEGEGEIMTRPKGYVDSNYLEFMARIATQYKQRTYALMGVQVGHRVLDVGCGPGTDTIPLAALVGAQGEVVGVDYDEAMAAGAERHAAEAGVGACVTHRRADAASLPFEPDYFDSARSERLFQHLACPERALSEMVRVTRPGGWIVVLDTDFGSGSIDTAEVEIERRYWRFKAEHTLHNGYSGRTLYRLFRQQGLEAIGVEMCPLWFTDYAVYRRGTLMDEVDREALAAGIFTESELGAWHRSLESADTEGLFFGSGNQVLAAGRKP